jgi:hypothetical protein
MSDDDTNQSLIISFVFSVVLLIFEQILSFSKCESNSSVQLLMHTLKQCNKQHNGNNNIDINAGPHPVPPALSSTQI